MAYTYSKIAESTVGAGGASTITFNNIPQNYTDLVLKMSFRSSNTTNLSFEVSVTFNGSTNTYSAKQLYGDGATAASSSPTIRPAGFIIGTSATANTFSNSEMYIPNYAGSLNKSYSVDSVNENNATTTYMNFVAGLWATPTTISSISLAGTSGSFAQYSTATLYGIRVEL